MSRKRNSLKIKNRRIKTSSPFYQASEGEIMSDLKRLKFVTKKNKTILQEKICDQDLKKMKTQEENDRNAVEMLTRLQALQVKSSEQKKEEKKVVKNDPPMQNGNCYFGHIGYPWNGNFDYQNYLSNMVLMQNQNFGWTSANMGFGQTSMMPGYYGFFQ
jgi:hypothetical protein